MLATLGELPTRPGWAFELKWDGVRAVTYVADGSVRVVSRNDLDVTGHYPELAAVAELLAGRDGIVDGEIVALDGAGRPSFARLQERMLFCTFMILNASLRCSMWTRVRGRRG
jgi:bifunctional non-homologous end joining protein LigD